MNLKRVLENRRNRKGKNHFFPSPFLKSARWPPLPFPRSARHRSPALPFPRPTAQHPANRQPSSRASPASRQATAAPPFRAQPLTAWPRCQSCPLPPASTPGQPQPPPNCARSSHIVGASPAPRPRFKGARPPARTRLLPALVFALAKHRGSPQPPQPWSPGSAIAELETSMRTTVTEPPPLRFSPW